MGTYTASKYVTARKAYPCSACGQGISKGAQYLVYQVGLKRSEKVCEPCSLGVSSRTGRPNYYAAVVDERLRANTSSDRKTDR
jgi:hypothetical protein